MPQLYYSSKRTWPAEQGQRSSCQVASQRRVESWARKSGLEANEFRPSSDDSLAKSFILSAFHGKEQGPCDSVTTRPLHTEKALLTIMMMMTWLRSSRKWALVCGGAGV